MIVTNITRQTQVADKVFMAKSFWERTRGLIGTPPLKAGEGLLLPGCMGIHMFGMSYPLDVIYLDQNNEVILAIENLKPNTFGPVKFKSCAVLEFAVGTIQNSKTQTGDQIAINGADELIEPVPVRSIPALRFI
jgi:uncharacterized membrane protein (UPF0127 family)